MNRLSVVAPDILSQMRTQLLKVLQRLPATGFAGQAQATRGVFGSYAADDSKLFSVLTTRSDRSSEGNAFGSFANGKGDVRDINTGIPSHISALSNAENNSEAQPAQSDANIRAMSTFAAANLLATKKGALAAPPPKGYKPYGSHAASPGSLPAAQHPFHLVDLSWWPIISSFAGGGMAFAAVPWMHAFPSAGVPLSLCAVSTIASAVAWWRDCNREANEGYHTDAVKRGLNQGMWFFITSEAALFFGFLWSCVHVGMSPNVWLQLRWPPVGIEAIGWDKRALMMSIILGASYLTANIAQYASNVGNLKLTRQALAGTIGLGAIFVADQALEYSSTPFTFHDSAYGSTFFLTTGFHGMHVILGSIFLAAAYGARKVKDAVGLRSAILYWHFVDIVWIGVYGIIYVGGY